MAEGVQHQQGPHDFGVVGTRVVDLVGPVPPPGTGACECCVHVESARVVGVGRVPGRHQVDHFALRDRERAQMRVVARFQADAPNDQRVRACGGLEGGLVLCPDLPHPRDRPRVVETHGQAGLERHASAHRDHPAHDVEPLVVDRHHVLHLRHSGAGLPARHQHERVAVVVPTHPRFRVGRTELPATVALIAEQRPEHGGRVESRRAEPVDAAASRHECGRAAVAQQSVVLDRLAHVSIVPVAIWPPAPLAVTRDHSGTASAAGSRHAPPVAIWPPEVSHLPQGSHLAASAAGTRHVARVPPWTTWT